MDKEENLVFRHLLDLAKLSFARDISVFSDFLNNREVAILKRQVADLPLGRFFLYGGIEDAERVMVCRRIEDKYGTVPSLRLDVIIREALNLSRTKVKALIDGDKVAVNSAASSSSHYQVSEGDVISVRGFGKFIFYGSLGKTKKDRLQIHIGKYC